LKLLRLVLPLLLASCAAAAGRRPNVVILYTDDQGTLDANCYGSTDLETPHIDRLAASGVRFTQAYAHTVCCPSRAALFTGRHPQRGGVSEWTQNQRGGTPGVNMAAEEVTLAEVLRDAGYRTALLGKWHLGAKPGHGPLDQGFETFFGHLGGFIDNYRHCFLHGRGFHDLHQDDTEIFRTGEYYPDLLADKAVETIRAFGDSPFFLTVAFNLPHYPEQPAEAFKDAYPDLPMPRQSYARVVSSVDHHIGRILDAIDAAGLRDDTIVILMSDNGHSEEDGVTIRHDDHASGYPKGHYYLAHGGGGNTGKWIGHKGRFLEGGIRVPAMIRYPGKVPAGEVRDQIVTVMDWFPTVLELCGIERGQDAPKLDGRSLLPLIADPGAPGAHEVLHFGWRGAWAVRRGEWKLISDEEGTTLRRLDDEKPEVEDHARKHPEIVAALTALHEAWAEEVEAGR
jgi:arylsulfatase A-like enzyme